MTSDLPSSPPTLLLFAKDLLFETRIRSTAEALGIVLRSARDSRTVLGLLANSGVAGLIVDLDCGEDAVAVVEAARREKAALRIVAFGPHVQAALLERAGAAGADDVMPRSRFTQQLPEILRAMVSTTR